MLFSTIGGINLNLFKTADQSFEISAEPETIPMILPLSIFDDGFQKGISG